MGKPDSGKSMFCRELALRISRGDRSFIGLLLDPRHNRAIYVTTEDPIEDTKFVLETQFNSMGYDEMTNENSRVIFGESLTTNDIIGELALELSERSADLVIIDSFGDIFSGKDQNANAEVRAAFKPFNALASRFKCMILFISHINKSAYLASPDQSHIQGAGAIAQKVRVAFDLRCDYNSDKKFLTVTKGNAIPKALKQTAMLLHFDEKTFLFEDTGVKVPIEEIGALSSPESKLLQLDWDHIFADDQTLKTEVATMRIREAHPMCERSAKGYIARDLLKVRRGLYARQGYLAPIEEQPEDAEGNSPMAVEQEN